jgi:cystathionine beta-lyase/cystathionine gamma-synthase
MPSDWLKLTTHRLDIYDEEKAKTKFLDQLEKLFEENNSSSAALSQLPTAYDYIRLGHPLSSILEWVIAKQAGLKAENVISFSSKMAPILAILRTNLLAKKNTQIIYTDQLPAFFDSELLQSVYSYHFELKKLEDAESISSFNGSTVFISQDEDIFNSKLNTNIGFHINTHSKFGSVLLVNSKKNQSYIAEIQHLRRRETIAMTPANCFSALNLFVGKSSTSTEKSKRETNKTTVLNSIKKITSTNTNALIASSGLSIQYAIVMGLINNALEQHNGVDIKIIVPPNCYGGTNDQARRVAACLKNVEVIDLAVDGDNNMVKSTDTVLEKVANEAALPFIIAEIPTNPRVEVPDLLELKNVLSKDRYSKDGKVAIKPVFILDQTFCPNVHFLSEDNLLSTVKTISYVSGSKFPSGGLCTAGYCVANKKAEVLMFKIEKHLKLCDNEATDLQVGLLAKQLPSMNQRIQDAYTNTRVFVNFIKSVLPEAKINFVSEELAEQGFTPSVFSLDLPSKGKTDEEKESYKRALNYKLINLMIKEIPSESKFCVSYGQLKGSYWTIPATSTQGTTKEADKDYIVRVALSANMDLERHKEVFLDFVKAI